MSGRIHDDILVITFEWFGIDATLRCAAFNKKAGDILYKWIVSGFNAILFLSVNGCYCLMIFTFRFSPLISTDRK